MADAGGADPALRVKALSAQWADAVARGDGKEAQRLNAAIAKANEEARRAAAGQDRNGLTAQDRAAGALGSAASELSSQIQGDIAENDFDPDEVMPGLRLFAEQAKVPADELRQEVLKRLRASGMKRGDLKRVEKALNPTTQPKPEPEAAPIAKAPAPQPEVDAAPAAEPVAEAPARQRPDIAAIRRDATLDKQTSENGKLMTRRQWVESKVAEGLQPKVEQEDRIKPMSRMAFFRATNEEQRAHERRIKEAGKKDVYWIGDYEVSKTEHDYAVSLLTQESATATPPVAAAPAPQAPPQGRAPEAAAPGAVMPEGLSVSFGGRTFKVESLQDAQAKWIEFRDRAGAGVSEVGNGVQVVDGAGRMVGRISYNGRIFDPADNMVAEAPEPAVPSPAATPQVSTVDTKPSAPTNPPAPAAQTRPERLIELRKREAVLKQLLRCLL